MTSDAGSRRAAAAMRILLVSRGRAENPAFRVLVHAARTGIARILPEVEVDVERSQDAGMPESGFSHSVEWDPAVVAPLVATFGNGVGPERLAADRCRRAALGALGLEGDSYSVIEASGGSWRVESDLGEVGEVDFADPAEWPDSWLGALAVGATEFSGATAAGRLVAEHRRSAEGHAGEDAAIAWAAAAVDLSLAAVAERSPRHLRDWLASTLCERDRLAAAHDALRQRYDADLQTVLDAD